MSHGHSHFHERRNILSDIESFLGVDEKKTTTSTDGNVVYVTASATFSGPIGGYVTGSDPASTATSTSAESSTTSSPDTTTTTTQEPTTTSQPTTSASSTSSESSSTSSSISSSISSITSSQSSTTTFSTATSTTASSTSSVLDLAASSTTSASPSATASPSSGLTGGAKAGIAIGVILGVGLIAGLIFFWMHKQRKNRQEAEAAEAAENEKFNASRQAPPPAPPPVSGAPGPSMVAAYPGRKSVAPRVSLRPMSQFNSLFNQPGNAAAAGTVGAAPGTAGFAAGGASGLKQINESAERPYGGSAHVPPQADRRQDPFTDPANPFDTGSQAGSPPTPISKDAPSNSSAVRDLTPSPTGSATDIPLQSVPSSAPVPSAEPMEAAAAGAVAGAVVGAAAVAATKSGDKPVEARTPSPEYIEGPGSRPQSPSVGGAPSGSPVSNVHRVQMDFVPSLADEMELRAGQLVRLLKTYDDGWTQCSSMDGSVKGIAPRTCLSARPLQPRRPPGPNSPGPRGPPPTGPNGRPMSPAHGRMGPPPGQRGPPPRFYNDGRPMTSTSSSMPQFPPPPGGNPRSMSPGPGRASTDMPRPLTPGGSRPSSPAGGRSRSNSASVSQMGGRPSMLRGSQSPLAPPTGPLPGPPVQVPAPAPASTVPPQLHVVNGRPQSPPVERKPVPGQQ